MAYKRKTRDYWELQGNYGHGWECLTAEETYREISQRRKEYRENEGGSYRIVCKREPITEARIKCQVMSGVGPPLIRYDEYIAYIEAGEPEGCLSHEDWLARFPTDSAVRNGGVHGPVHVIR